MPPEPRIVRSLAFVPAHEEDAILSAADVGLDAVGLDLEDLTPRASKPRAREIFRPMAAELAARGVLVMARTNGFADGACEADLDAVMCPQLHCVNLPKAESAEDVERFCDLLAAAEAAHGVEPGSVLVRPVIETARGIRAAYEIAAASSRVTYMGGVTGGFWGDLGATLGLITSADGAESLYLRSKVLVDVRAAGVRFPVGGGAVASDRPEDIRRFAVQNKHLGYTGSFTAPRRDVVEIVNEAFTPTGDEIAEWTAVLPRLEAARTEGAVVVTIDGRMYDTAGIPRVRDQLDLAARLGLA